MFSGIIRAKGTVVALEPSDAGRRLVIDPRGWDHRPGPGDSICVSGCCLTLAEPTGADGTLAFDVIPESLAKTTLGGLGPGSVVNLEASVTASTPMDGHVVQGHVEGVGEVVRVVTEGQWRARIAPPRELMPCLAPKGSVAVEGVSLTIAEIDPGDGWFEIALIPTTLELTTLGALRPGAKVNLETDILARTIVHVMRHYRHVLGEPG